MGDRTKGLLSWIGAAVFWLGDRLYGDAVFGWVRPMIPAFLANPTLDAVMWFATSVLPPLVLVALGIYFFRRSARSYPLVQTSKHDARCEVLDSPKTAYATTVLYTAKGFRSGTLAGRLLWANKRLERGDWAMMIRLMPTERVRCPDLTQADKTRLAHHQIALLSEYKAREDQLDDYIDAVVAEVHTGPNAARGFLHRLEQTAIRLDNLIDGWNEGHDLSVDPSPWNGVQMFTLVQAACLWAGSDPVETLAAMKKISGAKARYQMLTQAIEAGRLTAFLPQQDTAKGILVGVEREHSPKMLVLRQDLEKLATSIGERPPFLFRPVLSP
jgi:hypothetical protein